MTRSIILRENRQNISMSILYKFCGQFLCALSFLIYRIIFKRQQDDISLRVSSGGVGHGSCDSILPIISQWLQTASRNTETSKSKG